MNFRKKFIARKTACAALAAIMVLSAGAFTGCGSGNSSSYSVQDNAELARNLAYDVKEISIKTYNEYDNETGSSKGSYISNNMFKNDKIYYTLNEYTYSGETNISTNTISIVTADMDGNTLSSCVLYTDDGTSNSDDGSYTYSYIDEFDVDDSGNITYTLATYTVSSDGKESETRENITIDQNGTEISRTNGNSSSNTQIISDEEMEQGIYSYGSVTADDGITYYSVGNFVRAVDSQGNILWDTDSLDGGDNTWVYNIFLNNSRTPTLAVSSYDNDKNTSIFYLQEIDTASHKLGKKYDLTNTTFAYNNFFTGSGDYYAYTQSNIGIYGLIIAEDGTITTEKTLDVLSLGIDNSSGGDYKFNDDGSITMTGYVYNNIDNSNYTIFYLITPKDVSEVKDREIIELGSFYFDYRLSSAIAEFNKTNDDYIIICNIYTEENNYDDYDAAVTTFNNSITAGNVPDILVMNTSTPYDSYVKKGLFADLYEFIDKDNEISRDIFFDNVLTALESDGKLYSLAPSFYVYTMEAKTSLVGDKQHITIEEANAALEKMPEGATLFGKYIEASTVLGYLVNYGGFVDYANGTCNFDSDDFKAALELANQYPASIDWDKIYEEEPNYWDDDELAIMEDKKLFANQMLYRPDSIRYINMAVGEAFTFTGYPSSEGEEGSNASIVFPYELAISAKSNCPDGAWEFIKNAIISDSSTSGFKVIESDFDKACAESIESSKNSNDTYYVGGSEIEMPPLTQEDIDTLKNYITKVTNRYRYDDNIINIVNEEAALFFDGTKTVDETAQIIQSRASLYMSEQY